MSSCAQDSASRIVANDVTVNLNNNTPANCIAHCEDNGYTYAGVEYGSECHCGTGFVSTPTNIATTNCNAPCAGNSDYACGGSWAIQLYKGQATSESLPEGWTTFMACAGDNGDRVIYHDSVTQLSDNTPATCVTHCGGGGYTIAGVEYGNECHCGNSWTSGNEPAAAPSTDCSKPCAGNPGLTCGGSWRIQLYTSNA